MGGGEGVCKLEKMVTGVCAVNFVCGEKHESKYTNKKMYNKLGG